MREISFAINASAEECVELLPPDYRAIVEEIRRQKLDGTRRLPSSTLIDQSAILTKTMRVKLVDAVASLVDENVTGRADMCLQFASLIHKALSSLNFPSRSVVGKATYYGRDGKQIFAWDHAWVRIGDEVIDGNVDSLDENPTVPKAVRVAPYWGPITRTPSDRKLHEYHGMALVPDHDVETIWWPDLQQWIDRHLLGRQ
jgi:hypothetical protein